MHDRPISPLSPGRPAPRRRATKLQSCDRSHAASTVSKSPAAQMCALLSLVHLSDQHPPASRCDGERLGEAPWDGEAKDTSAVAEGSRGWYPGLLHLGTCSADSHSAKCRLWLSRHPQAGGTALQEEQAVRCWQHLSQGDNKSYQRKPIRRQQDNPHDNPASAEASSAPCQCCGFTDKCHSGGTVSVPAPASSREVAPPPAHPCPVAVGATRARPGMTQQSWPWCAWWDEQTEWSWSVRWQGSTWIGEDGERGTCRTRWHRPACCAGPAVSNLHRLTEPCHLHPSMGVWASRRLDHQSTRVAGQRPRNTCVEICVCVCVCTCDTGSVSPRLRDSARREQRHV